MKISIVNKVRRVYMMPFLLLIFMLSGCAGLINSEEIKEPPQKDIILAMTIKSKLIEAEKLSAAAIHVEASNGFVVLTGFVETEAQKQLASKITGQTTGVKQIDNQIQVK